ncbi:MAG TPA: tetratricopeptide repeat protein [Bacteroides sp.]|nr:tetratricopeptide repeat protein [Bacteroides sp.]
MRKLLSIFILFLLASTVHSQTLVDSLQNIVENTDSDSTRVEALMELTEMFLRRNLQQSVEYGEEAVKVARETGSLRLESWALTTLGAAHYYSGNYDRALEKWMDCVDVIKMQEFQAVDSTKKEGLTDQRATLLNNIGVVYKTMGEYDKAIEYYQENLKIQEAAGNLIKMAWARTNIANVYFAFEIDFELALEYYQVSLDLFLTHNEEKPEDVLGIMGLAQTYMNMGIVYKELDSIDNALDNFSTALQYFENLDNSAGIAATQRNLGSVYMEEGNFREALEAVQASLDYYHEIGQLKEEAEDLKNLGKIHYHMQNYSQALEYMNQSLVISRELDLKREMFDVYRDKSNVYRDMGNFRPALENYELYTVLKDSSIREENLNQISELETKYQTERVERENVLLNTQNELQEAQVKRQRIFLFSVIGISIIILVFGFVVYRQYQEKKKANILLNEQNIEIKQQRDQIFQQKQEITDSIQYASRIQNAILPPDSMLSKLQEHFILYKPRDIVSGDYYWMTLKDNKTIVAVADCTGHGVPGAFMSMLGISFMNEIVNKSDETQANEIMNQLRGNVISSLGQTGEEGEAQDGMDMALCVIDTNAMKIQYSGAYNPLYIIRNNELLEFKPDKMPIGIYMEKSDPFSNHDIDVEIGDAIYMFSDGYVDQFGGARQKKFMTKNFKELLLRINKKPMKEQRDILDNTIQEWMGAVEQIDDILVLGLRI